jgi:hypothetical protein
MKSSSHGTLLVGAEIFLTQCAWEYLPKTARIQQRLSLNISLLGFSILDHSNCLVGDPQREISVQQCLSLRLAL